MSFFRRMRRRLKRKRLLGAFDASRLTPQQKRKLERKRRKFFEEDLNFDDVRRNNRKRALYSLKRGNKLKVLERHPRSRTIIDVAEILKRNTNN